MKDRQPLRVAIAQKPVRRLGLTPLGSLIANRESASVLEDLAGLCTLLCALKDPRCGTKATDVDRSYYFPIHVVVTNQLFCILP